MKQEECRPFLKFHLIKCSGIMSIMFGISFCILISVFAISITKPFSCLCVSPFVNIEGMWSSNRAVLKRKLPKPGSLSTFKEMSQCLGTIKSSYKDRYTNLKVGQGKTMSGGHCKAGIRQGKAKQRKAGQGRTGQGRTGQDRAGQGRAGQDKARQGKACRSG